MMFGINVYDDADDIAEEDLHTHTHNNTSVNTVLLISAAASLAIVTHSYMASGSEITAVLGVY